MHKPQWGGHVTLALVLASRCGPGGCPAVARPGAMAGGHAGVPAMRLLAPLHLHCGQQKKREVQASGTEGVNSPRPLEAALPSADEVRKAGPEDPEFPLSQVRQSGFYSCALGMHDV